MSNRCHFGAIKTFKKWVGLAFRWLIISDYWSQRIIKRFLFQPRYQLTGACKKCGRCCELIGAVIPGYSLKYPIFFKWIIFLYEKVNGLTYVSVMEAEKVALFTCNEYDADKGRCQNYGHRPAICRNYPLVRYFEKPIVFDECGFSPQLRKKRFI